MSGEAWLEGYLAQLRRALALYSGRRADVLDEVRDHLLEARERLLLDGASPDMAQRAALAAFGEPALLARGLVAQRARARARLLLPLGLVLGLALAFVDSRPAWDDTGVSAFAVLACCGLLGLVEPARPTLWAAAVGVWFPLFALLEHRSLAASLALVFALGGAWGGRLARRLLAS
jgi:HAAS